MEDTVTSIQPVESLSRAVPSAVLICDTYIDVRLSGKIVYPPYIQYTCRINKVSLYNIIWNFRGISFWQKDQVDCMNTLKQLRLFPCIVPPPSIDEGRCNRWRIDIRRNINSSVVPPEGNIDTFLRDENFEDSLGVVACEEHIRMCASYGEISPVCNPGQAKLVVFTTIRRV